MRYVIIGVILLAGCSASSYFTKRTYVTKETDQYDSEVTFLGVTKQESQTRGLIETSSNHLFRSFVNKETGKTVHQLYIDIIYAGSNWNFFYRASYEGGHGADLIEISSDVLSCYGYGGCSYREVVGITVPEEYMQEHSMSGFGVKLSAKSGEEIIIQVSSNQINSQLSAVGRYRKEGMKALN